MDSLIQIVRKLALAGLWIAAIIIGGGFVFVGIKEGALAMVGLGLGVLLLAWVVSGIINWIFDN